MKILCGLLLTATAVWLTACGDGERGEGATLKWYVFNEPSGAFAAAARDCSAASGGDYHLQLVPLPADADQQREQLVRRLAARDSDIDLIGMDVIWTAEFAQAGWILPWSGGPEAEARAGRIPSTVTSASYKHHLWAVPFTTNTQLLWYRRDRVAEAPQTWDQLIRMAGTLGSRGTIEAQGERYEGLTVFFISLLASAGGRVLDDRGRVDLAYEPTQRALAVMKALATSPAADPALSNAREDQARLAFQSGNASFMLNYTYVWPSARHDAPQVFAHMGWARWPRVVADRPSRVTLGGINIGVGAYSRHPQQAFAAAACIASADHQRLAARRGGLPPTVEALYEDPAVQATFPFADLLRATLRDATQRPQTPFYSDVSLAISHTLHPMSAIDPERDVARLRAAVERALHSEGLL